MSNPLDLIAVRFANKCDYSHNYCKGVAASILTEIKKGTPITNDFLTKYLMSITGNSLYYWSKCITYPSALACLVEMCNHVTPSEADVLMILEAGDKTNDLVMKLVKADKVRPTLKMVKKAIPLKNFQIIETFSKHIEFDRETLELLCDVHETSVDGLIEGILNQKIELTEKMLVSLVNRKKERLANMFIQMGCPVGLESLNAACTTGQINSVRQILQCNVTPDKNTFNSALSSSGYVYSTGEAPNAHQIAGIIDLLIETGYNITYDDIFEALKKRCYINGIERFKIDFKEEFIVECTKQGYYPYPNISVKPNMECLKIECGRTSNLTNIKKLVKSGLKPDIECLRAACNNKSNVTTLRYLINDLGIRPDIECIRKIAPHIGNQNLNLILQEWDPKKPDPDSKDKVVANESDDESVTDSPDDVASTTVPTTSPDVKVVPSVSAPEPAGVAKAVEPAPIDPKDAKSLDVKKTELAKLATALGLDEEFDDFKIDVNGSNTPAKPAPPTANIKTIISLKTPDKTPKDKRSKTKIKATVLKLFQIKKVDTMSFIELRKHVISYITTNNLYDKDDKTLIKLDKKLCTTLKLDDGYIKFDDLDKLVSQAYK